MEQLFTSVILLAVTDYIKGKPYKDITYQQILNLEYSYSKWEHKKHYDSAVSFFNSSWCDELLEYLDIPISGKELIVILDNKESEVVDLWQKYHTHVKA